MHAEFLGHTADHWLRLGGPVHPHRTLTQLQRVLPRGRHRLGSSHTTHLTACHHFPHLGGTSRGNLSSTDASFEAWQVTEPRGWRFISLPGGDLAVWSRSGTSENRAATGHHGLRRHKGLQSGR
ncbi:DUF6188 family protein [Streptomyces sp. WM4235]|uniref:DUF6188 family protein n=1 Tax=Streptomyces sp. WM4235 TaxID=1415551 RepID=UPI003B638141